MDGEEKMIETEPQVIPTWRDWGRRDAGREEETSEGRGN